MSESKTTIKFDLRDHLTEKELESFKQRAKKAGAKTLTEHFINMNIRIPQSQPAA